MPTAPAATCGPRGVPLALPLVALAALLPAPAQAFLPAPLVHVAPSCSSRSNRMDGPRAVARPRSPSLPRVPIVSTAAAAAAGGDAEAADEEAEEEQAITIDLEGINWGEWVEPWLNAASRDVLRVTFDCYDGQNRMVIDPWLLSELLLETGAYSSQIEDAAKGTDDETPIFGEHGEPAAKDKLWAKNAVMADYGVDVDLSQVLALVKEAFQLEGDGGDPPFKYRVERIADRDWQREVQEGWKPIRLGEKLLVKFTWHGEGDVRPFLDAEPGLKVMTLEGGAAFGSGEHATTAMCCEWLERHLTERQAKGQPAARVIDYGSGSGLLAFASLMFGAESAVGVEIDPVAIQSAYRNAEMNGIETVFLLPEEATDAATGEVQRVAYRVLHPDGALEEDEVGLSAADVVVANILARPLADLAPTLAGLALPGGRIVLAGLLEEQAETVMAAYRGWFDDIRQERTKGDWALLVGTRNDSPVAAPGRR